MSTYSGLCTGWKGGTGKTEFPSARNALPKLEEKFWRDVEAAVEAFDMVLVEFAFAA